MRKTLLTLLCFLCAMAATEAFAQKKVHTIGDSTMDSYNGGGTDKMGWGGVLQQFFNGTDAEGKSITVKNMAKSGSSSRTFYTDSRLWPTMKAGGTNAMKAGDLLIIQFAHNDENNKGVDALELKEYNAAHGLAPVTDLRGTTPTTTYKECLRTLINEAKAMGVKPILVGAICRNYFNGSTIKKSGEHNLADGYSILTENGVLENQKLNPDDNSMNYTYQMGEVAAEYDDVPFINFTQGTKTFFEKLGSKYCSDNIFNVGDGTHTGVMGATLVAHLFALELTEAVAVEQNAQKKAILEELAQYVSLNSDITLTPESADMGKTYVGTSVTKTFNITGFDLVPATGTATVSASDGFLVSLDNKDYSQTLNIGIDGGNMFSSVYVKGTPMAEGIISGTLTVSYEAAGITRTAALSIEGIINTTGTESYVTFPLNASAEGVASGNLLAGSEVIEGMVVGSPSTVAIGDVDYRRYKVDGEWPNNIDEVSTRYVQLSAEVPAGKTFRLDKISLNYAGSGTNNMNCKIYYSTDPEFNNEVLMKEHHSLANNTTNSIEVMPMRELTAGEKIYVRIYPWINADGQTGKYICLSNLVIHGYAEDIPEYTEETTTWDFSEFGERVFLNDNLNYSDPKYALEYTKDDMPLLCVGASGTGENEYIDSSYGFHCNGTSAANRRYIKFSPQYNGALTVTYRSNNGTANDRIVAVATSVKTFSTIPEVLDEGVLAAGYTQGSTQLSITATLTAGTTYYAYFANGGSSLLKLQYDYQKPTPTGIVEVQTDSIYTPATGIYSLSGARLQKPQRGLNIINGKKVLVK